ncbi:hypothetical protein ARMGADRAFT_1157719 [Armillaria gallica]|uniref:F-box domain-containing protein n=1 Tax=Armillaria gallica TaxID=47427 RepID=A0A2H3ELW8_ARMGA|nr:hypothetical protein ARMGADRAFT_1157719 [Armillaria gallica]
MSSCLLALPEDILLAIFARIPVEDLLSLIQTCRVLHALGSTDYVWHQIKVDLPLDVPPGKDINSISGPELHRAWVRGLRLERNWRRHASQLRKMCRIIHGGIVFRIQFLGSQWLITLSRAPTSALHLSVWYIGVPGRERRYLSMDVPSATTFAASLRNDGRDAIVAILMDGTRTTKVKVYSIALESDADSEHSMSHCPQLVSQISQSKSEGTPGEVRIYGDIVVVAIAYFENIFNPPTYRFIVLSIKTGSQISICPKLPEHFSHVHFRLFPRHMVIAGMKLHERLVVRIHDLSPVIARLSGLHQSSSPTDDLDTFSQYIAEYETDDVPADSDYTLSDGYLSQNFPCMTALSFHASAGSLHRPGTASVFSFPSERDAMCPRSHGAMPVHVFPTPASAVSDIVCIGSSGRRAVWLERRWDTDVFTLMKGTFSPEQKGPTIVEKLLPPHLVLPFEVVSCQSLAFEESTGRVCLGLHTGDLYVLYF